MLDRVLIVSFFCTALVLAAAPYEAQLDDRGVITFGGELDGMYAHVGTHGPGWSYASAGSGAAKTERVADRLEGVLPMPPNCAGDLLYTMALGASGPAAEIVCSEAFTERTTIEGAYLCFFLPAKALAGKRASLPHGKAVKAMPVGEESPGLSGPAAAFTVELDHNRSLVIACDTTDHVLVQNNRQYGNDTFEVRFLFWPKGQVFPGMALRRVFRVAVIPTTEIGAMIEAMNPPIEFDAEKPYALLRDQGQISVMDERGEMASINLAVHGLGWSYASQGEANAQASGSNRFRTIQGALAVPDSGGGLMEYVEQVSAQPGGALDLQYRLHFPEAAALNGYQLSVQGKLSTYSGASVDLLTADGEKTVRIGTALGEKFPFRGEVTRVHVGPDDPRGFEISVDEATYLLIQDNRGWGGDTMEFRFCFLRDESGGRVTAGETVNRRFGFRLNGPMQLILNESGTSSKTDTGDWVPFVMPWDQAPVDVSFLNHKPAGTFGFVTRRGDRFVFTDSGEEIRFWGTCFSAGANFPSHTESEKIAARLAKFGVNIVRTHHADAPWAERHFFPDSVDHTREFDPENLDRFDYLMHCLKREGIYVYLDQLVHRHFKTGDGVDAVDELPAAAKPYSNFDPKLIALQKEFSRALWTHVNPYTGLAYRDDPAIALMEYANENDMFTQKVTLEPYRTRLEARYRAWARGKGMTLPEGDIDFTVPTDPMMRFFIHVQHAYYQEMRTFLRDEVGVRVPLTGSNWSRNAALLTALDHEDFTDSHAYQNHPGKDGSFGNKAMVDGRRTIMDSLGFQRVAGKPFFVSEWDEPWPSEWRAELPLWMAAVAAFQGWNGLTVYTYRHTVKTPVDSISGAFETFNDPARFGLFANAALIYRRGDVQTGPDRVSVTIPEAQAASAATPTPWSAVAFHGLSDRFAFQTVVGKPSAASGKTVSFDSDELAGGDQRRSDTGEIRRNIPKGIVVVDTARSQAVQGRLADGGQLRTADLTATSASVFGAIVVSSLSDAPIRDSERLLLTAVGRAENASFAYNITRNKKQSAGSGPILVDLIEARIALRTERTDLVVIPVTAAGKRLAALSTQYVDGQLTFSIGRGSNTIFYMIESDQHR
ncbi:MAG: hypothetical protein HN742_25310 [Lentisphaerae bacterium]|nr:hypothetical protein [Lentisphaerota bacterium]MBT4818029.1 hypothetical protein [Lentisphaerota bacterium]MBT5607598.1 hypothetical protein [Lentisphaerota bacterium]MBT7056877.1 hypothetical protein [Lentisphaerota bacterium]MBT7845219.1 hypothetical protein [Lentisphaerota bacterium]